MPRFEIEIPELNTTEAEKAYVKAFSGTVRRFLSDFDPQTLPPFVRTLLNGIGQDGYENTQNAFLNLRSALSETGDLYTGYHNYFGEGQFAEIDTIWQNISGNNELARDNSIATLNGLLESEDGQNRWNLYQVFQSMRSELTSLNLCFTSANEQRKQPETLNNMLDEAYKAYNTEYKKFRPYDNYPDYEEPESIKTHIETIDLASDILKFGNFETLQTEQQKLEKLVTDCDGQSSVFYYQMQEYRENDKTFVGDTNEYIDRQIRDANISLLRLKTGKTASGDSYDALINQYLQIVKDLEDTTKTLEDDEKLLADLQKNIAETDDAGKALKTQYINEVNANKEKLIAELSSARDDINSGKAAYYSTLKATLEQINSSEEKAIIDENQKIEQDEKAYKEKYVDDKLLMRPDPKRDALIERKKEYWVELDGTIDTKLNTLRDTYIPGLNQNLQSYQKEAEVNFKKQQSETDGKLLELENQIAAAQRDYDTQITAKQTQLNENIRSYQDELYRLAENDNDTLGSIIAERAHLKEADDLKQGVGSTQISAELKKYEDLLFNENALDAQVKEWAKGKNGFSTSAWNNRLQLGMKQRVKSAAAKQAADAVLMQLNGMTGFTEKDFEYNFRDKNKDSLWAQYKYDHWNDGLTPEQMEKNFQRLYESYNILANHFESAYLLYTPIDSDKVNEKGLANLDEFPTKLRDEQGEQYEFNAFLRKNGITSINQLKKHAEIFRQNAQKLMDGPRLTELKTAPEKNAGKIKQWTDAYRPVDEALSSYRALQSQNAGIEDEVENKTRRSTELKNQREEDKEAQASYKKSIEETRNELKKLESSPQKKALTEKIEQLKAAKQKLEAEKINRAKIWEEKNYTSFLTPETLDKYRQVEADIKEWNSAEPKFVAELKEKSETPLEKEECQLLLDFWEERRKYHEDKAKFEKEADIVVAQRKESYKTLKVTVEDRKKKIADLIAQQKKADLDTIEAMITQLKKDPESINSKDILKLSTAKVSWDSYKGNYNPELQELLSNCKGVFASEKKQALEQKLTDLSTMMGYEKDLTNTIDVLQRRQSSLESHERVHDGKKLYEEKQRITEAKKLIQITQGIKESYGLLQEEKKGCDKIVEQVKQFRDVNNKLYFANQECLKYKADIEGNAGRSYGIIMGNTVPQIKSGMNLFLSTANVAKNPSHSNTQEFKDMFNAVKTFLGAEITSVEAFKKSLKDVQDFAQTYLDKKNAQTRLRPSKMRIARLNYAKRLVAFCKSSLETLTWTSDRAETESMKISSSVKTIDTSDGKKYYATDAEFFNDHVYNVVKDRGDKENIEKWGNPEQRKELERNAQTKTSNSSESAKDRKKTIDDNTNTITKNKKEINDIKQLLDDVFISTKHPKGFAQKCITKYLKGEPLDLTGTDKENFDKTIKKLEELAGEINKSQAEIDRVKSEEKEIAYRIQATVDYDYDQNKKKKYSFSNPELSDEWHKNLEKNLRESETGFGIKDEISFDWEKAIQQIKERSNDPTKEEKKAANALKNPYVGTKSIAKQNAERDARIKEYQKALEEKDAAKRKGVNEPQKASPQKVKDVPQVAKNLPSV